jgi:hypothetical protein
MNKRKQISKKRSKGFKRYLKKKGDIPHRFHDTNIENLESVQV